jgi:hypothetical protein
MIHSSVTEKHCKHLITLQQNYGNRRSQDLFCKYRRKICEIAAGFKYFTSDFALNVYKVPKKRLEYYI